MFEDTIDRLIKKNAERDKALLIQKEDEEEYKKALNQFAATREGRYLFSRWLRYIGIFHSDDQINPAQLIVDKGKRDFYLKMIRPYLDKKNRKDIESYD